MPSLVARYRPSSNVRQNVRRVITKRPFDSSDEDRARYLLPFHHELRELLSIRSVSDRFRLSLSASDASRWLIFADWTRLFFISNTWYFICCLSFFSRRVDPFNRRFSLLSNRQERETNLHVKEAIVLCKSLVGHSKLRGEVETLEIYKSNFDCCRVVRGLVILALSIVFPFFVSHQGDQSVGNSVELHCTTE